MDLTDGARFVVATLALIVSGFALAVVARVPLAPEHGLALLGGAVSVLLLVGRRRR